MKLQLNTPREKIAVALTFVMFILVAAATLQVTMHDTNQQVSVQPEVVRSEPEAPTREELDEAHSSWLFSSSESASLVDAENGFSTVTIGRK